MKQTKPLFSMGFNELCQNFNETHPAGYTGTRTGKILFVKELEHGSLNDLLQPYLVNNGIPYMEDMNGRIWFSDDGYTWKSAYYEVRGTTVTAYEII